MPFECFDIGDDVICMVVSCTEGEDELVARFTLTVRREDICLNAGDSWELGYPVIKGFFLITEHDKRGDEVVPQYSAKEGVIVEDLLCLLIFLECWVSEVWYDWEDATRRRQCIQELHARFEQDGLNLFVPGWEIVGKCYTLTAA